MSTNGVAWLNSTGLGEAVVLAVVHSFRVYSCRVRHRMCLHLFARPLWGIFSCVYSGLPCCSSPPPHWLSPSRRPRNSCWRFTTAGGTALHDQLARGEAWRCLVLEDRQRRARLSHVDVAAPSWITETDQLTTLGPDGRKPTKIAVRGYTDEGDATEDFGVDANGIARWKTSVDEGSATGATRGTALMAAPCWRARSM